ncbi:MAG: ChaN family lipoprotein [SAR324 cluster bacterium]|nr:ChaN family lipoprotein [SAR324 cluster bacterium]
MRYYILILLLVASCSQMEQIPPRQDPLVGKIYKGSGQEMTQAEVYTQALKSDVIYLGESHENKDQHKIQLELIGHLIEKKQKIAIGLEFFYQSQTSLLMSYVQGRPKGKHGKVKPGADPQKAIQNLRERLGWAQVDDETWEKYFAFIALAKKHDLVVFGADLPRSLNYRISRNSWKGLTGLEQIQAPMGKQPTAAYEELMKERFTAAHCGWSEEKLLGKLYETWRARNEAMAISIANMKPQVGKVVMIVGGGHVENNLGLVSHLKIKKPQWKQMNIGLTEIPLEESTLGEILAPTKSLKGKNFGVSHDIFWFTGRHSWVHPCKRFQKQLSTHKTDKK